MKSSISKKVILIVLVVLVMVISAGTYVICARQADFLTQAMKQELDIIVGALGNSLAKISMDQYRNKEFMQGITEKLSKTIGVAQIEVYDLNKVVIADTDREELGEINTGEDAEDVIKVLRTQKAVTGEEMKEGKKVYSKCFPIHIKKEGKRELVGVAEVTMDLETIEKTLSVKEEADILATLVGLNLEKMMDDQYKNSNYLQMLTEKLGRQPGLDQVQIYDTTGKIIADTDKEELGTIANYEDVQEILESGKTITGFEVMEGEEVYRKAIPVLIKKGGKEEITGAAEASMSLAYLQGRIASTHNEMILLATAIVLVLSILMVLLLRKNVVSPILKLMGVTKIFATGDLSKRAQIRSRDEIGDLATSFNQMADEIQKRNEELQTMNEELRSSNEELQTTTEELETSNEELRETQEELIRKEKLAAVGQLAAGVGHELRNPLGVIKNAVYYVKTKVGREDPKLSKHLDIIEREINNSNKIISDLLGFSKVRPPELIPADVNEVIEEAIGVASIPGNVKLNKNLSTGLPKPTIDRDQIRQVFLNIIMNAYQAMPQGGELGIYSKLVKGVLNGKDCVEVGIADTGTGIKREDIDKIFDPFYTTKAKGIGLGLAVTRQIVEKHNGVIDLKSEVDKGTTFIIGLGV